MKEQMYVYIYVTFRYKRKRGRKKLYISVQFTTHNIDEDLRMAGSEAGGTERVLLRCDVTKKRTGRDVMGREARSPKEGCEVECGGDDQEQCDPPYPPCLAVGKIGVWGGGGLRVRPRQASRDGAGWWL